MAISGSPRLAIIGCAASTEFALCPALRRIGWHPSVLIDNSSERLEVIGRKIGHQGSILKSSSWQSVLTEFDAALVPLPHALRGPTGTALLEAGKHVFMDAPLAITAGECRRMIAASSGKGVTLSVGLYRRYLRIARWTKALIESGLLGEIKSFDAREGTVFNSDTSSDLLSQPDLAGGGVLVGAGAHTLDLVMWWLGEVASVKYYDDNMEGFEADCMLECELTSGASGHIELSRTRNLRNSIRIEGTSGFVEVRLHNNEVLAGSPNAIAFRHDGASAHEMKPQFVGELFDGELKDFRTSASGGEQAGVPGWEGAKSVALIEKCYAARQPLVFPWAKVSLASQSDAGVVLPRFPRGSKVVVTGATGFVGGRLVERLVEEHGARVSCIIRNRGRAARLGRLPVELICADLCNATDVNCAVDGAEYVFHCAYDVRSRRQNVVGLRNLIDACVAHSIHRLIHVSTFAIYEPFPDGPLTEGTQDGDRSNAYVDTKLDLERMIFEAVRDRGLAATIVQPSVVYGPFCWPWTNTPAEMLIFGDVILPDQGEGLCNAVYIDDVVDGLILAATSPAAIGERFIVSGPEPVTWATFFNEMARALGTSPPKFWPRQQIVEANRGDMRNMRLAISDPKRLIKMILRWKPVRQCVQAVLDAMPEPLRILMTKYYFGSGRRRAGESFVPNKQALAHYCSKAIAGSEKARSRLGYQPRFDFQRGMLLTSRYLEWAYGDIRDATATERRNAPSENVGT